MKNKIPFSDEFINELIHQFGTPFFLYDANGIINSTKKLLDIFSWHQDFKEYFAVKATPNLNILKLLYNYGLGFDCSSMPELISSERIGASGSEIMFTSNNTPLEEFIKAKELNAYINLDDISHLYFINDNIGLPEKICFRYNPGNLKKGNSIIGQPEDSKFGLTRKQLFEAYKKAKDFGVKKFGLHTMAASNELNPEYFIETAKVLFNLIIEIKKELNIEISFVNMGGGLGIPYHIEDEEIDLYKISEGIKLLYHKMLDETGMKSVPLFMECGRYITGPHGYLISKVRHLKNTYKNYAGIDSSINDLMRPALYNSYHHISVLGKNNLPNKIKYDITGSLCENNDKFAKERELPILQKNDILIIHDAGAHCQSMSNNYNGKLRSKELLVYPDGKVKLIRRAETIEDYFSTTVFGD